MSELCWASMTPPGAHIATKKISPVEAVQAHLDRVAPLDGKLMTYITVMGDNALVTARAAESAVEVRRHAGAASRRARGFKGLYRTKGVKTTGGWKILADWVPEEDAPVVARLARAGAIALGKVNMHEFAVPSGSIKHATGTDLLIHQVAAAREELLQ